MNYFPKRGAIGAALTAVALALILSFKTPSATGNSTGGTSGNTTATPPGARASRPRVRHGTGTGSTGQRSTFSGQLTGTAVQTPFGTVQVQVTMQNGQITDVQALQMPSDQRRSQQISQYAAPQLRSEALTAQSAQVDSISGATYTQRGLCAVAAVGARPGRRVTSRSRPAGRRPAERARWSGPRNGPADGASRPSGRATGPRTSSGSRRQETVLSPMHGGTPARSVGMRRRR